MAERICEKCGQSFQGRNRNSYVCIPCRTVKCETCGLSFEVRQDKALSQRFCSKKCRRRDLVDWKLRFLPKVERGSSCWEWQGKRDRNGYGRFKIEYKEHFAHRLAYEIEFGEIPEGLRVLHRCDNPPCCNPAHLFAGTQADNVADMISKQRDLEGREKARRQGERHHKAQLSEDDVRAIRTQRGQGRICREIAEDFGVTREAVQSIVDRRKWRHIQ